MSYRVATAAETLLRLVDDPRFAGQSWTWDQIGAALGLNIRQAREVIYYIRKNATEMYWTVGTFDDGYETMATQSFKVAWPGLLNQLRHLKTRLESMAHAWEVLSRVDPDVDYAAIAGREGRAYRSWSVEVQDRIDNLLSLMGDGSGGGVTV